MFELGLYHFKIMQNYCRNRKQDLLLKMLLVNVISDQTNFPHNLLLTNTHVQRLGKVFANNSLVNIKLFKTQLPKIEKSEGYLGRLLGSLLEAGVPLMKNALKPLAKSYLVSLRLIVAASSTDAGT